MRFLLLFVLCFGIQSDADFKKQQSEILIYIDDLGPDDHSYDYWEKCCVEACNSWFLPAGFSVTKVNKRIDAEIVFTVGTLEKRYGQCDRRKWVKFPHIPNKSDGLIITIESKIGSMPHKNLNANENLISVLRHEVGHSIGLDHMPDSIMTVEWPRPIDLTPADRELVLKLKRFLESK